MTSVPPTSLGSGARIVDLFPLPLPIFLVFKLCHFILKHWYLVGIVLLFWFVDTTLSIAFLLAIPLGIYGYVWYYNRAHSPRAVARAALYLVRTRAKWKRACESAELNDGPYRPSLMGTPVIPWSHRPPRIANESGTSLEFTLNLAKIGLTVQSLEDGKDYVAATLSARRSRVTRITPGIGRIAIEWEKNVKRSSVANPATAESAAGSLHSTQLPRVQLDEDVLLELDTSLLVVGESGSGKSNLTWNVLNGLNDYGIPYRIYVADPKKVELVDLINSPYLVRYADNQTDILAMIDEVHQAMMATFESMRGRTRKITIGTNEQDGEQPLKILIIDEIILCSKAIKKGDADTPLGEILSAGRAAGYIVIANSQLGQVDTIGRIRDLFPQRVCLATKSADLTNATLGPRAEERGARCSEITERGVGYIYTDYHGTFQRFRPPFIPDSGVQTVAMGGVYEVPETEHWSAKIAFSNVKDKVNARKLSRANRTCYTYRLYDQNGILLYVGKALNPTKRIPQHVDKPFYNAIDHGRTIIRKYPSEQAALEAEQEAIENEHPRYNLVHRATG